MKLVKRGVGEYQINKAKNSIEQILIALSSGQWVQYKEIVDETGLSTATVSKFLKVLEKKKYITKKVDLESGKYPYPVFYRIRMLGQQTAEAQKVRELIRDKQPLTELEFFEWFIRIAMRDVRIMVPKDAKLQDYIKKLLAFLNREDAVKLALALKEHEKEKSVVSVRV